ncbi:MAG: hypothetical protein J07AB43_14090, partial [Candidatus Nanosalina sp. J07AB43]
MPTDNLEVFKKVIFHLPRLKFTTVLMFSLALVYSSTTFYLAHTLLIDSLKPMSIFLFGLLFYLLPGIISPEFKTSFLPEYPRRWGYFLSLVNQFIFFIFSGLALASTSFAFGWQIIWFGLITLYVNNFFVLTLSVGPNYIRRISMLSLVQPVMILIGFHFVLGQFLQISWIAYAINFLVILGAGLVLLLSVYFTEYLVGSNVTNISILNLAAGLLQNEQDSLDLGRSVRPDVQTLQIKNRSGVKN